MEVGQKVYISKYALTKGIEEATITRIPEQPGMITTDFNGGRNVSFFDGEWHPTLEEAKTKALALIETKRKSITKQLAKLDKLEQEFSN